MKGSLLCALVLIAMLAAAAAAPPASASESRWNYGYGIGVMSKYLWRGQNYTDGFVAQPDLWFANGGFTFDIWSSVDLSDANGRGSDLTELDFTAQYDAETRLGALTLGAATYTFPGDEGANTSEFFAGVSPAGMPLNPELLVYYDCVEADGAYFELRLSDTLHGAKKSALADWMVHLGYATSSYNDYYFGTPGAAFNDLTFEVSRSFDLGGGFSLTPTATYTTLLDDAIRRNSAVDDNFALGIILSYEA